MSVAFVQNKVNAVNTVTTLTAAYTSAVVAGNLLLVCCWQGNDNTDDTGSWTVTDTLGNTYTRFAHSSESQFNNNSSTGSKIALFACLSGGSGANTISVGFGASKKYGRIAIWEYSGTDSPVSSAVVSSAADTAAHPAVPLAYFYQTSTTAADPGSNNLRLNNSAVGSVTAAYLDSVSVAGNSDSFLSGLPTSGIKLRFFQDSNINNWLEYDVTNIVNNTGWWTVSLTFSSSNGTISQTGGTPWWALFHWADDTKMPSVTAVDNGRVGCACEDLNGSSGTGSFIAGTGYGNLLNTALDGYLGTEDKASVAGAIQPTIGNQNYSACSTSVYPNGPMYGVSWAIAPPAGAAKQTIMFTGRRAMR